MSAIFRPRHIFINGKQFGFEGADRKQCHRRDAAPSVGMARSKPVTGDLAKGGVEQYANLSVSGNRVR